MKPIVSIVISCYNDSEFIEQSVQSALDQTYPNKEVIVVDDGSNQKTKAILKELEPKINCLITQKNEGPSAARNRGIEAATGEYILVLDSDDYFEPEFCAKAVKIFEEETDGKLVTCHARWFWDEKIYQIFKPKGGNLKNYLTQSSALGNSLFRKKDWKLIEGYDEMMLNGWEDWEFFIRLHKEGGKTYVIPEVLFHYRKRKKSRTTIANNHRYDLLNYIYLKHADLFKENFELFTKSLLGKIKKEEEEKLKNLNRMDFKIGKAFLWPYRKIKNIFLIL